MDNNEIGDYGGKVIFISLINLLHQLIYLTDSTLSHASMVGSMWKSAKSLHDMVSR